MIASLEGDYSIYYYFDEEIMIIQQQKFSTLYLPILLLDYSTTAATYTTSYNKIKTAHRSFHSLIS